MQRLERPQKHWKFSAADIRERGFWADYMRVLRGSNPRHGDAASTLVRGASGQQVVHRAHSRCGENVDLTYPKIDAAKKEELAAARAALARER